MEEADGANAVGPSQNMLKFESTSHIGARVGELILRNTKIATPNYVANTSRGSVPHLTQDMQRDHTSIDKIYLALEDFIEKRAPKIPPIYKTPLLDGEQSRLRKFTGSLPGTTLVMGPRRIPALATPASNTHSGMEICTSVGFRPLAIKEYIQAAHTLQPDIVIGPADIPTDEQKPSIKRIEKAADRTTAWMKQWVTYREDNEESNIDMFAPLLPAPAEQQRWYLNDLKDEMAGHISGLAIYDSQTLEGLPTTLAHLPRLNMAPRQANGPLQVLKSILAGIDLFILPFIGQASDAGIILDFRFPPPATDLDQQRQPIGINAWNDENAVDLSPLREGCTCYACSTHHRAFLHHLCNAKEMLAWVLLQVHNHQVVDEFFAGVRESIASGHFGQALEAFERYYQTDMPEKTGQGPRERGYQFKSVGRGEPKKNPKSYNRIDDTAQAMAEAAAPAPDVDAAELMEHGMGTVEERQAR